VLVVFVLIAKVRDWLNTVASTQPLPSGSAIATRFALFQSDIPAICATLHLVPNELTFVDYGHVVRIWLEQQAVTSPNEPIRFVWFAVRSGSPNVAEIPSPAP
jgi:hypothetical protein